MTEATVNLMGLTQRSVYSLTDAELKILLNHYTNHEERYKYLEKIEQIKRALIRLENKRDVEPGWMTLAREDRDTKAKWISCGAKHREWHSFTIWTLDDVEFYKWSSGVNVTEEIHRLREADERFIELIERSQTHERTPTHSKPNRRTQS